jgi:hypothetical protein
MVAEFQGGLPFLGLLALCHDHREKMVFFLSKAHERFTDK